MIQAFLSAEEHNMYIEMEGKHNLGDTGVEHTHHLQGNTGIHVSQKENTDWMIQEYM